MLIFIIGYLLEKIIKWTSEKLMEKIILTKFLFWFIDRILVGLIVNYQITLLVVSSINRSKTKPLSDHKIDLLFC